MQMAEKDVWAHLSVNRHAKVPPHRRLGRVDKAYPYLDCGEFGEAEEAIGRVVVSGCDPPGFLEAVEEPFDPVAQGVERSVDGVLDLAVPLCRYLGDGAAGAQVAADVVSVVALVGEHDLRVGFALGHQRVEGGAVMGLARRQDQRDWKTLSVGPGMDLGREATARAAKSLVLSPPLAPAARWCARIEVLSIICSASLPPPCVSAWKEDPV